VLSQLPVRGNLKQAVRRARRVNFPKNPVTLADLDCIDPQFQTTTTGEPFLLYDSKGDSDFGASGRVLVFATRKNLEHLASSNTWYVDGTFKVAPSLFTQLFTILGSVEQFGRTEAQSILALPFVYALRTLKEQQQYEAVLKAVRQAATSFGIDQFQPARIMSDFELSIINACCTVFPSATISGCLFHLGQNVLKRVVDEGLKTSYEFGHRYICYSH